MNSDGDYKVTEEVVSVESVTPIGDVEVLEHLPDEILTNQVESDETVEYTSMLSDVDLTNVIECMLFVSSEPLSIEHIASTIEVETEYINDALINLEIRLQQSSGLQLVRVAGGYQVCTKPEYADYCTKLLQPAQKKLSKAGLETLAIIAYRQPCTVPEIEAVRGVSVGGVVKTLTERGLVREAGKKHAPGKPTLYATTEEFLQYFGLNDLSELPDIDELAVEEVKALEAQRDLFEASKEQIN